ncbi:hypothetical protein PRIPAC_79055 [Pristionchus pacificus]|nr:hypothetical protein PRIPAC_79055 [Pristionchus pacificus]|eukprot:PDM80021.1 Peptidase [Pristionchus pacificus]
MSKLIGYSTVVLVLAALGVAIASLVFNILVFNKINEDPVVEISSTLTSIPSTAAPDDGCPDYTNPADVSDDPKWKEAADRLIANVDRSVDPCQEFYDFSCGKYIQNTDLAGQTRKSTFDETQYVINLGLADYFDSKALKDLTDVEKYQKNFLTMCYADAQTDGSDKDVRKTKWTDLSKDLNADLGFPLFGKPAVPKTTDDLFGAMGSMERKYTGGPLMTSYVTADYKNSLKHALYINQPALHFTRDYFVKPQYIDKLQGYAIDIRHLLLSYADSMGVTIDHTFCAGVDALDHKACAQQVAEWAVQMETSLAMSSWPGTELRNYKQQYTAFDDLDNLDSHFNKLNLGSYVVLSEPNYFSALNGQFDSGHITLNDYTNYLAIHFLMDNAGEYGIDIPSADAPAVHARDSRRKNGEKNSWSPLHYAISYQRLCALEMLAMHLLRFEKYITRRGHGARKITRRPLNSKGLALTVEDEIRTGCVDTMIDYMPFGPGYTYVRNRADRDDVRKDVTTMIKNIISEFGGMLDTLDWIDKDSLAKAHKKCKNLYAPQLCLNFLMVIAENLIQNYLWPDSVFGLDFNDFTTINAYHINYASFLDNAGLTTYWDALKTMKAALMKTEQWDIVTKPGDRTNFLQSPATVNAWYQPERNSITIPFGIVNPPFYSLVYPQNYNYGGLGGVCGHELTHGYDDEGTQFNEIGELAGCDFTHCSILDDDSRFGFVDMAQCVVQQFNSQCCPLKKGNVRCVNGETTQGENIADIGGQQAAYRAYHKYISDKGSAEKRLPGLESFTPDQIFWITYGGTWCMKLTDERLARQLMTDVHSPSSCRVDQVMQDIPQFGQDFLCKRGTPMYPVDDDRCKVWVGF